MAITSDAAVILSKIKNPLIFFALSLLVIEAVLAMVVTNSNLSAQHTFYSVCIMSFLFFCVVGVVTFITVKYPAHLYEGLSSDPVFIEAIAKQVDAIPEERLSRIERRLELVNDPQNAA